MKLSQRGLQITLSDQMASRMHEPRSVLLLLLCGLFAYPTMAKTHYHRFVINEVPYTRLCQTKNILTVNGQFPGPTLTARRGDTVVVRVHNPSEYNITIHWHGAAQMRNPWSDGPEYITQCPIRPGTEFTYRINFEDEEGTIWWHAHSNWDRATVHGAIVVLPRLGSTYPFPTPHREIPIILGEWWVDQAREVIAKALRTGADTRVSDVFTINGQPGSFFPCSEPDAFKVKVEHGKAYLFRVINAAPNNELFFAIAGHRLTLVGTDASYTKPYTADYIMIASGQSMDLLLEANQSAGRYYMAARSYASADGIPFDNTTTTAILEYHNATVAAGGHSVTPSFPYLPKHNDTDAATKFTAGLRSLASKEHPIDVPQNVDKRMIITIAMNTYVCTNGTVCEGPYGQRISASLNNVSFVYPTVDVLEAYYYHIRGVYNDEFPNEPPLHFNFTGDNLPLDLLTPRPGTEVKVLEYGTSVEIVFQDTDLLGGENHPMHLHGQSFYVVGLGFGNYDEKRDVSTYNLVDPPFQNTVGVPRSGWAAIRFRANNPGVWYMHCHLDRHMTWGMNTVFIVKNGEKPDARMLPAPLDMPPC